MTWFTPDPRLDALLDYPYSDPDLTPREARFEDDLAAADRRRDHGLAYTEQPHPTRGHARHRQAAQEREAQNALRPRTGHVQVQPRRVPCTCGAAQRGLPYAGPAHKHSCALHATRVDHESKAA